MSLALDRNYVAETLTTNVFSAATSLVGPGITDWDGKPFMENANGGKPYIDNSDPAANLAKARQLLAEAGYPDGQGFPTVEYAINDAKYSNPDYDELMKKASAEPDPQTRSGYLHQAEDIFMADMGTLPLMYYNEFYLQSSKITGSWHSPSGFWYFQYADIAE